MKMAGGELVLQGGTASGDSYSDDVTDLTVGYIKKFTKSARWFVGARNTTGSQTATDDRDNTTVTYGMRFDY